MKTLNAFIIRISDHYNEARNDRNKKKEKERKREKTKNEKVSKKERKKKEKETKKERLKEKVYAGYVILIHCDCQIVASHFTMMQLPLPK